MQIFTIPEHFAKFVVCHLSSITYAVNPVYKQSMNRLFMIAEYTGVVEYKANIAIYPHCPQRKSIIHQGSSYNICDQEFC